MLAERLEMLRHLLDQRALAFCEAIDAATGRFSADLRSETGRLGAGRARAAH
jgi:hypothetical protein